VKATPEPQPATIVGPGSRLQEELDARGWTQKDLAEIVGRPSQVINEIVRGIKQITPETAIQLGHAFDMSPEFWLDLETKYRLRVARQKSVPDDVALRRRLYELVPVAELTRRGWLPKTSSLAELAQTICTFLGIASPKDEPRVPIARLRHTPVRTPESRSKIAWIKRAQALAAQTSSAPFETRTFKRAVPAIFGLAATPDGVLEVPSFLGRLGVRLVFVPHLPRTYLDGATFWDDSGPVIVLTLRYDRLDYFWFTLGHELVHVLRRDSQGIIDEDQRVDPEELAADAEAANSMIDHEAYQHFVASTGQRPGRSDIERFAADIGRHPSIVLGRLQYDEILTWAQFRDIHVGVRDMLAPLIDRPLAEPPSLPPAGGVAARF
jgi:HTH-type transcriptional regulator/antitoxin HigA